MLTLPIAAAPTIDVLSDADAIRYQKIFSAQDKGLLKKADKEISKLQDKVLLGHVKFQRFMHPTAYRSRFSELRDWLASYNDHPEAFRVYGLAMKRKPEKANEPKKPIYDPTQSTALVSDSTKQADQFIGRQEQIAGTIRKLVRSGKNDQAARMLKSKKTTKTLSAFQQDVLAAHVAMGYFIAGKDEAAYVLAATAAKRSGTEVGQAHWVAGLASFRSGQLDQSVSHFEANALAKGATPWTSAAGAFWAGRIHQKQGNFSDAENWLKIAAQEELTFYGQLALQSLDKPNSLNWQAPSLTQQDIDQLLKINTGKRALALLQIGDHWRADQELHQLVDGANSDLLQTILTVSVTQKLPRAAIKAANQIKQAGGELVPAGLYPISPWEPPLSDRLDIALVSALMRQESLFNPRATSSAGARGLMQLLPATANYALGKNQFVGSKRDGLFNPKQNVAIAARYIHYLLAKEAVNGGLFELAIAYNAGIGNLTRWQRTVKANGDPLLFIEAIPSRETRNFVERVLANYWIYREQLGKHLLTRNVVVLNDWPKYEEWN